MAALLITMILAFLIETGGRTQHLCAILADRFGRCAALIAGIATATLINAVLSAVGGILIHDMIAERPLQLFQALALLFAAAAMLFPSRRFDRLDHWRIGPFAIAYLGVFILQFGDSSQFFILATAAREDAPTLSAIGGGIGIGAAIALGMIMGEDALLRLPLRPIRIFFAILILLAGIVQGLTAMGIIGGT